MITIKKLSALVIALLLVVNLVGCSSSATTALKGDLNGDGKIKIGVLQFIQHASLDASQKGILDYLESKGYDKSSVTFDIQNGTGDVGITNTMAQKMVNDGCDLIIAIATPAGQAAYNFSSNKNIPVVYAAISDPISAGLTDEKRTTGVSDMLDTKSSVDLVKQILPSANKIGVVHNSGEVNSMAEVENLKKDAESAGLEVVDNTITNVSEVALAVENILAKSDILVCVLDNTIGSSMDLVCGKALEKNKMVIGSEESQVKQGAVASVGADYYAIGQKAGEMAYDVLQGVDIASIKAGNVQDTVITINKTIAERFAITIPEGAKVVE